jgi:23S rRNA (uracil1939-C5)-methyltransferase
VGIKRDDIIENVEIIDFTVKGQGVAKIDNQVIFVKDTFTGDQVDLKILKKRKGVFEAIPTKFNKISEKKTDYFCSHFKICGGCKIQDVAYKYQAEFKQAIVEQNLKRIGQIENPEIRNILEAPETKYYRNKLEYSFSNNRWITEEEKDSGIEITDRNALGFHIPGKFDKILNIEKCYLQNDISNKIRNHLRNFAEQNELSFYDIRNQNGFLRNLIIRTTTTNELLVAVVFGEPNKEKIDLVLNEIRDSFHELTSLYYFVNEKVNDSLYDLNPVFYSGKPQITEEIGQIKVLLGPKSFFQTNSRQAKNLYDIILESGDFNNTDVVYDLYSGVGSIGLYIADKVEKVIGIETVQESVEEAGFNKDLNKVENAEFYVGQVENLLTPDFFEQHGKPNTIILDPPRPGIHKDVVESLLNAQIDKIVYVSCNPSTQARDIEMLSSKYEHVVSQPVDMFPHTLHVENVALLKLKL